MEKVECSKEVYDILVAFNNLPSLAEQEEVMNVIYDELYKKSYLETMRSRVVFSQSIEIDELHDTITEYEKKTKDQKNTINNLLAAQGEKKRTLRAWIKGLLIIINNIKHYLGDSWEAIFPGGAKNVDAFLKMVDTQHIMDSDTWSQYEAKESAEDQVDSTEDELY